MAFLPLFHDSVFSCLSPINYQFLEGRTYLHLGM